MAKPNPQAHLELQQKLQEIGTNLYRIRTERGISLDAIAEQTMITKRVLVAIEQGEVNQLPEPFYTQALIEKYARALGVAEIPDYTNIAQSESQLQRRSLRLLPNFRLRSTHLYLLYLLIVGISVRVITFNITNNNVIPSNGTVVESSPETNHSELIQNTQIPNRNSAQPQLISQSNASNLNEVTVDVDLKDRCWMKVIVDGEVIFEGTLPSGTHRTWKGKQQVTIVAGNAGGVVVTYNNGKEKILGEPGQVQEVTYTVN
ncbi:MAG TPA: helix-turn-helix domain-containing protein [Xenococcaceae cyanobacterium]|jgi:cytoskeletal protein RodZ